jgi:hypothetical protein
MVGLARGGSVQAVVKRTVVTGLAVVAALGVAAAIFVLASGPGSRRPAPPPGGIVASATVTPTTAFFGDAVIVRAEAVVDPQRIDPSTVSFQARYAPYEGGTPSVTRRDAGGLQRVTYTQRLRCFVVPCLPPDPSRGGRRTFDFGPITVSFKRNDRSRGTLLVTLSTVDIASRLSVNDAAQLEGYASPPFRVSYLFGRLEYTIAPAALVALLLAGAALLLAIGTWLALRFVRRPQAEPPQPLPLPPVLLSPLERALLAVERARAGGLVPEERKALELLASELGRNGDSQLAVTAKRLAWSHTGPAPAATVVLTKDVRALIARSDGHPH